MADDQDVACLRRFYSARPAPTPPCDGTLTVVVNRCSDLLAADSNGKSDPFVTLQLSGSDTKVQTSVHNKTLDPVFNEKFEMQVTESATKDGRLELVITAIDKDTVGADDFLGDVVVDVWALLGEAEGKWTGTVQVPKTFAFGDSSGKLGRDEKKNLQTRCRSGITAPYGTIEVIIGFQVQGDPWVAEAATWTDVQWEDKCSKIIGTYRKKAEKKFIHERIIEKERSAGALADDDVEPRRNELAKMKTKKLDKIMKDLGVSAAISDSDELALVSELRDLMYSDIAKKYSLDPRDMKGAQDLAAATNETDGASEGLQAEQHDVSDQQTKAVEAAKVAAELEEQVAEATEAVEIASATELAIAEEQHRKVQAAEEETAAAAAEEAKAAALAAAEEAKAAALAAAAAAARAEVEEAKRLAAEAAQEESDASAPVETETPVAAETIAEAARQQQQDEAEASAERAQTEEEEVAAAARGARGLETIETPAEHQPMHAVETRPAEDAQEKDAQSVKRGASAQRDVDAMMAEEKALANAVVEQQARQWINAVRVSQSQEPIQADAGLADALRSGVILCELLSAIRPDVVVKPSKFSNPQHHRENIGKFVTGCTALGVPDAESFETVDLYEGSNLPQVWRCLASLGKHTPKIFTGPAMPSAATIRAELSKAAADAKAQKAATEEEEQGEGESGAAAQACADEEPTMASAPEPAPPQQSTAEPVEDEGKGLADEAEPEQVPVAADEVETEQVAAAADEKTRLLDNEDAASISEGVPPPQQERKRWWCCAASKTAAYVPPAGTEDA